MIRKSIFVFTTLMSTLALDANAGIIKIIEINGNHRISKATIDNYLGINVGDNFSQQIADQAVKNLFSTGFFADVQISEQVSKLVVNVEENPQISQIAFEGNKHINDSSILKEILMKERSIFSNSKLQSDIKRIRSLYQRHGRYSIKIEPKLIKLDQNRVNLVYEIDEGVVAKIKKIQFFGNNQFPSSNLKSVLLSQEQKWYSFFSSTDVFDQDKMQIDKEMLKNFYYNEGYADFEIISSAAELSTNKDAFLISFTINEGQIYKFSGFDIESKIPNINTDELKTLVQFKQDKLFNLEMIKNTIDRMTDYLGNKGYAFVDVDYDLQKDPENKTINVKFTINETYKIYINQINIKNNTRTLDKVIRREFQIAEGDPYNISKVSRSHQKIRNLGFFESVNFKNLKTAEPDKVDIEVEVKEKSTGSINFGLGYDTVNGVFGQLGMRENNFLGKGQTVSLDLMKSERESNISFSFTEPYYMDKNFSLGFDIFKFHKPKSKKNVPSYSKDNFSISGNNENSFNLDRLGFGLRGGYSLTDYTYHEVRYSLTKKNISDMNPDASIYLKEQIGKSITSLVGHTLTYDKLDSRQNPTEGYFLSLSQDLAGVGGDTYYFDNRVTTAAYYPVYKRDVIFNVTGKAGLIKGWNGRKVKISDSFFMGGNQISGFEPDGIGPRDSKTKDSLGGTKFYTITTELFFPLGLSTEYGIKGIAFHHLGSLFDPDVDIKSTDVIHNDKSLRCSYGLGIIWHSPLGVIRLDYAIPYKKQKYDEKRNFRFSVGTNFY